MSMLRRIILGTIGVIVSGVLIWGLVYSTGSVNGGEIVEGKHYEVVAVPPPAPARRTGHSDRVLLLRLRPLPVLRPAD